MRCQYSSVLNFIYLFERERRVRRAILISVPHRGSPIADNWIGNLGQSLYRADREVQEAFRSLLENHPLGHGLTRMEHGLKTQKTMHVFDTLATEVDKLRVQVVSPRGLGLESGSTCV